MPSKLETVRPPAWLVSLLKRWQTILGLNDWHIGLGLGLCPMNDPRALASVDTDPQANAAKITIRADIEDSREWRRYALHELLHVAHCRIDDCVEEAIIKSLPHDARMLARRVYNQHLEAFIEQMAAGLVRFERADSGLAKGRKKK